MANVQDVSRNSDVAFVGTWFAEPVRSRCR